MKHLIVDTRYRTAVDGALMAAALRVGVAHRRGRWFDIGGVRYTKHDPGIIGTVTGVQWSLRGERGAAG